MIEAAQIAWKRAATKERVKAGWKESGLVPWNPDVVFVRVCNGKMEQYSDEMWEI